MGKIKHLSKIRELLRQTPVIRAKDVELIVKSKGYASLILHNLVKRGEIKRITKGYYTTYEDPIVAVFCFKPAYLGLQEALSLHGLWEQETNVVVVTLRKVRVGVRKILGSNVIFHRIDKRYFFGYDLMRYGEIYVPVSDVEKTFIDLVYFNEIPDRAVLKRIKKRIDRKKLNEYLKAYSGRIKRRILRFLL